MMVRIIHRKFIPVVELKNWQRKISFASIFLLLFWFHLRSSSPWLCSFHQIIFEWCFQITHQLNSAFEHHELHLFVQKSGCCIAANLFVGIHEITRIWRSNKPKRIRGKRRSYRTGVRRSIYKYLQCLHLYR